MLKIIEIRNKNPNRTNR